MRPFKLFVDNKSAIALSKNLCQHNRSKHIETKFHFIRDYVEKGYVEIEYVNTESQLADLFKNQGRDSGEIGRREDERGVDQGRVCEELIQPSISPST